MLLKKPYIGITGFMSSDEVRAVLSGLPEAFVSEERLIMFGVLASWKTLNGLGPSNPKRYPLIGAVKDIFQNHPLALNLIHYNSREPNLAEQLVKLSEVGGENCHGFQLNMVWPSARELEKWRNKFPESRLVLQIGSRALNSVSYWAPERYGSPRKISFPFLIKRLREYRGIATDVLIDPSGGRGRVPYSCEIPQYIVILEAVKKANPSIGIGFAGGLSANTLPIIKPLFMKFSELSIDAESGVRTDDNLDPNKSIRYLFAATEQRKESV